MKRSGSPRRKTPLRTTKPLRRSASISSLSDRRRSQAQTRREIVASAIKVGVCLARPLGGCYGPLVGHEIVKRSAVRDAHIDRRFVIAVCSQHNSWVEDHPRLAQACGLAIPRWVWERDGQRALDEAQRLRERLWTRGEPGVAYWSDPELDRSLS